jgi:hypothetical protein
LVAFVAFARKVANRGRRLYAFFVMHRVPDHESNPAPGVEREGEDCRRVHPDDEADMRAALAELAAGRGVVLTEEQARHWAETGEWPESLD